MEKRNGKMISQRIRYLGIAGCGAFAALLAHAVLLATRLPYAATFYAFLATAAFLLLVAFRLVRPGLAAVAWLTLGVLYTLLFLASPLANPLSLFCVVALLLFCSEITRLYFTLDRVVRTQTLVEGSKSERKVSALLRRQFLTILGVVLMVLAASAVAAYLSLDVVLSPPILGAAVLLSLGLIGIVAVVIKTGRV